MAAKLLNKLMSQVEKARGRLETWDLKGESPSLDWSARLLPYRYLLRPACSQQACGQPFSAICRPRAPAPAPPPRQNPTKLADASPDVFAFGPFSFLIFLYYFHSISWLVASKELSIMTFLIWNKNLISYLLFSCNNF